LPKHQQHLLIQQFLFSNCPVTSCNRTRYLFPIGMVRRKWSQIASHFPLQYRFQFLIQPRQSGKFIKAFGGMETKSRYLVSSCNYTNTPVRVHCEDERGLIRGSYSERDSERSAFPYCFLRRGVISVGSLLGILLLAPVHQIRSPVLGSYHMYQV